MAKTYKKAEVQKPRFNLRTHFVVELGFHNGFPDAGHSCSHFYVVSLVHDPGATFIRAGKFSDIFPIIHLIVQSFVAGVGLLHDADCQAVTVQVAVERHREHDGDAIGANAALHVEEVVGQEADAPGGGVVVLNEGADFRHGGAYGGLRGVMGEAAGHVNPGDNDSRDKQAAENFPSVKEDSGSLVQTVRTLSLQGA